MLDYDGCMPSYLFMTEGKQADVRHAQYMLLPKRSVVVADRGYQTSMLFDWEKNDIYFVVRLKKSINHEMLKELPLRNTDNQRLLKDELGLMLTEDGTKDEYPKAIRRLAVYDEKNNKVIELITNNLTWTASTIAELYKQRWMVEIFSKN